MLREGQLSAMAPSSPRFCTFSMRFDSFSAPSRPMRLEGAGNDAELIQRLADLQSAPTATAAVAISNTSRRPRTTAARAASARLSVSRYDSTAKLAPPKVVEASAQATNPIPEIPVNPQPAVPVVEDRDESKPSIPSAVAATEHAVDVTLLNRMMNLVGELVLTRNQVLQATVAIPA